ncbi:hypothetical protein M011DRAFT_481640 [Sporormia fimetaria CBS 119925]|uniref:Zn(2)-C6 fungal-type domain-containing protein n=1 Tax=Sporormia fimetaria CBS 119925 TaxID=1340428 RepID=A0A6A6UXH7_9PLEO|nr:hypothetical protein M011DRAFT_481640 [Sporormia fimetaria CBS 119925]
MDGNVDANSVTSTSAHDNPTLAMPTLTDARKLAPDVSSFSGCGLREEIQTLQKQLLALRYDNESLQEENTILINENNAMGADLYTFKANNIGLKAQVRDLNEWLDTAYRDNTVLRAERDTARKAEKFAENRVKTQESEIRRLNRMIDFLGQENSKVARELRLAKETKVTNEDPTIRALSNDDKITTRSKRALSPSTSIPALDEPSRKKRKLPDVPQVVSCTKCYSRKWSCDGKEPCQHCERTSEPHSCKRILCKYPAPGMCRNLKCTLAHQDQGFRKVVLFRRIARRNGVPEPVDEDTKGEGDEVDKDGHE